MNDEQDFTQAQRDDLDLELNLEVAIDRCKSFSDFAFYKSLVKHHERLKASRTFKHTGEVPKGKAVT